METRSRADARKASGQEADRLWELNPLGQVWHLFTSVRLALSLILLLTAAVLAGTLLMQAPPSVLENQASYELWLERARGKYGGFLTDVFDILLLFNVFHSVWFRLLLALLTANLLVSSINRWKGIWITAFGASTRMGDAFFQHARFTASLTTALPVSTTAERISQSLRRSRYRVRTQIDADAVAIYADRNRLSGFGSFLNHMSLVLILAGATVGSVWGFTDSQFIVAEGSTRQLGLGTNISVGLVHFVDEYYLDGPPKDFRSEVVIYDKGVPVKEGTIRVNSPMSYEGIRFHQSFFGQTAEIKVADPAGQLLFSEQVPQPWITKDVPRPLGSFSLPEQGMNVYVIGPISGQTDPLIPAGEMRVELYEQESGRLVAVQNLSQGTPKELAGLDFTFQREGQFTGLKVVKNPGINLIWIAATLMIVGLVTLFYFPHRRLWALCKPRPDGTTEVSMRMTAQRDIALSSEFDRINEKVAGELGVSQKSGGSSEGGRDV